MNMPARRRKRPPTHAELRARVRTLRLLLAYAKRRWAEAELPAFSFNQRRALVASRAAAEGYVGAEFASYRESLLQREGGKP